MHRADQAIIISDFMATDALSYVDWRFTLKTIDACSWLFVYLRLSGPEIEFSFKPPSLLHCFIAQTNLTLRRIVFVSDMRSALTSPIVSFLGC